MSDPHTTETEGCLVAGVIPASTNGMENFLKNLAILLLIAGTLPAGTFTGVVTDSMCGMDHAMMKVTPDSKCVMECVKAGSKYAIFDGKTAARFTRRPKS
jgi:hypothetical protein